MQQLKNICTFLETWSNKTERDKPAFRETPFIENEKVFHLKSDLSAMMNVDFCIVNKTEVVECSKKLSSNKLQSGKKSQVLQTELLETFFWIENKSPFSSILRCSWIEYAFFNNDPVDISRRRHFHEEIFGDVPREGASERHVS